MGAGHPSLLIRPENGAAGQPELGCNSGQVIDASPPIARAMNKSLLMTNASNSSRHERAYVNNEEVDARIVFEVTVVSDRLTLKVNCAANHSGATCECITISMHVPGSKLDASRALQSDSRGAVTTIPHRIPALQMSLLLVRILSSRPAQGHEMRTTAAADRICLLMWILGCHFHAVLGLRMLLMGLDPFSGISSALSVSAMGWCP